MIGAVYKRSQRRSLGAMAPFMGLGLRQNLAKIACYGP